MMTVPGKKRGYLLSVVAAALAVITIGSLIVAAYASKSGHRPESQRAEMQALYAAESGLLLAEKKLDGVKKKAPVVGDFVGGQLPRSGAKYRCEVLKEHHSDKEIRLLATGSVDSNGPASTVEIEAAYKLVPKHGWRPLWRRLR